MDDTNPAGTEKTWKESLLRAVIIFNLADLVLTMLLLQLGLATEANPVMAQVLASGTVAFALAKMALVSLGVTILWRFRERNAAVFGTGLAFGAYACLMAWHMKSVEALVTAMV